MEKKVQTIKQEYDQSFDVELHDKKECCDE